MTLVSRVLVRAVHCAVRVTEREDRTVARVPSGPGTPEGGGDGGTREGRDEAWEWVETGEKDYGFQVAQAEKLLPPFLEGVAHGVCVV